MSKTLVRAAWILNPQPTSQRPADNMEQVRDVLVSINHKTQKRQVQFYPLVLLTYLGSVGSCFKTALSQSSTYLPVKEGLTKCISPSSSGAPLLQLHLSYSVS
jgi:hypothetical protein